MDVNMDSHLDGLQKEKTKPVAQYEVPKVITYESTELLKALGPAHTEVRRIFRVS
jgi:hypothetical protein